MTETEFSALLDDLKWCFHTPASTVIELGLMRLGVPDFYTNMLRDIDVHIARSTITAHSTTVDIAGLIYRQLHGTGQGTVEGPINWIPIADIVISMARQRSTQPVTLPTGAGRSMSFGRAWFVDDSGLAQAEAESTPALQRAVDGTGLMDFLQCTLAPEREVCRRWCAAIERTIAAATADTIIVEAVVACWTHHTDGTIHPSEAD